MFFVATAGVRAGVLTSSASLNYRAGYDLDAVRAGGRFGVQQEVGSYTTVDLFLSYELPETVLSGTVLTLNVDNLLDKDPPFYNGCVGGAGVCGFANRSTLGRLVTFGLHTHFQLMHTAAYWASAAVCAPTIY